MPTNDDISLEFSNMEPFNIGTLSPSTDSLIPTVTDNAFADMLITANEIGISFEPTKYPQNVPNGELSWGKLMCSLSTLHPLIELQVV